MRNTFELLSSLVIPFLRLGEFISGGDQFPLNSDALKKVLMGEASKEVLLSIFNAVSTNWFSFLELDYFYHFPNEQFWNDNFSF